MLAVEAASMTPIRPLAAGPCKVYISVPGTLIKVSKVVIVAFLSASMTASSIYETGVTRAVLVLKSARIIGKSPDSKS